MAAEAVRQNEPIFTGGDVVGLDFIKSLQAGRKIATEAGRSRWNGEARETRVII